MAVTGSQVSVGTTATQIAAVDADGGSVSIYNPGASTVYLGGSAVTTSGYGLVNGAGVSIDLDPSESVYGIVASGTQTVHVLKNRA